MVEVVGLELEVGAVTVLVGFMAVATVGHAVWTEQHTASADL